MKLASFAAPALLACVALFAGACHAPAAQHATAPSSQQTSTQQAHFALYKFGQRIGVEHARISRAADGSGVVKTTFTFNDRGTDVPLAAEWRLMPGGVPWHYQAWGFAARGVSVDDRVDLAGDGSVEVDVEGQADAVDQLIKWLRRGPSLARVTAVEIDDSLPPAGLEGFTIRT